MQSVYKLDIFRKLPKDLTEPTFCGALVSVVCTFIMIFLGVSEIHKYLVPDVTSTLEISTSHKQDTFHVNLDITFFRMPCDIIGLNLVDSLGNRVADYYGELHKHRISGAEPENKQKIKQQKDLGVETWTEKNSARGIIRDRADRELKEKQGCRFEGFIELNRVPGNFHIGTHAFPDVVSALEQMGHTMDHSFRIDHLSFGEKSGYDHVSRQYPSVPIKHPVDGFERQAKVAEKKTNRNGVITTHVQAQNLASAFFVDAVPCLFESSFWFNTELFQIKAAEETNYDAPESVLVFNYQISQATVRYSNTKENIFQFVVNMMAICGGVFTVFSMMDSAFHKTSKVIMKARMGKQS